MAAGITINIADQVSPTLERLQDPNALLRVNNRMGLAVQLLVQRHLRAKGPNKKFPSASTSFWGRAAAATSMQADGSGAVVSINQQGILQRLMGGPIQMRDRKLTIPAVAEAYGRRAPEFGQLDVMIRRRNGKAQAIALGQETVTTEPGKRGPRKKRLFKVLYWLVASVTQKKDPSVLPTDQAMEEAAVKAGEAQLRREIEGAK